ncbi:MAG: hypothetical protein GWN58_31780, partial [Anaerolineae bacterium]|nr:hypothetical protein [Anaerolineae bacterium]
FIQYRDDSDPGVLPTLDDLKVEDLNIKLSDVFETEHGRRRMLVADNVSTTQRDKKGNLYPSEGIALVGETEVPDPNDEENLLPSIFVDPLTRTFEKKDAKTPSAASNTIDAEI